MIIQTYLMSSIIGFAAAYIMLPILLKWAVRRLLKDVPENLGSNFSIDMQKRFSVASENMLKDLKVQVISHLVEPWIKKCLDRCVNILANGGAENITQKYSGVLVEAILKKRVFISIVISQFAALFFTVGWVISNNF